jgi:hypothetical protein
MIDHTKTLERDGDKSTFLPFLNTIRCLLRGKKTDGFVLIDTHKDTVERKLLVSFKAAVDA